MCPEHKSGNLQYTVYETYTFACVAKMHTSQIQDLQIQEIQVLYRIYDDKRRNSPIYTILYAYAHAYWEANFQSH